MKTIFQSVLALAFVLVTGSAAFAQSGGRPDSYYIGRAHSEVGACLGEEHGGGPSRIEASVAITGICFVSGELRRVTFYEVSGPPCHSEPCPRPFVRLVAEVDFGCDDEIVGSTCY